MAHIMERLGSEWKGSRRQGSRRPSALVGRGPRKTEQDRGGGPRRDQEHTTAVQSEDKGFGGSAW